MKFKEFGCVFLIMGTTIGAAMLALPIVTASEPFWLTVCVLLFAWACMTAGAWALMSVNCRMPLGSNLLTMSRHTLGRVGYVVMWVAYLFLLYSLICAYLTISSDVLNHLIHMLSINLTRPLSTIMTTAILAFVVYHGVGSVDWVNRFLMVIKLSALLIIIASILPSAEVNQVWDVPQSEFHWSTMMVVLTSFGFAIILPTLRVYLGGDERRLKRVCLIGSIIPLIVYLIWIFVIQAVVPRTGMHGLLAMNGSEDTASELMAHLTRLTHSTWMHVLTRVFVSICALTAFLSVSICMFDFLSDGLSQHAQINKKWLIGALTFLPPMCIVLFNPRIFTAALAYAGFLCLLLLIILPALMWVSMKRKSIRRF